MLLKFAGVNLLVGTENGLMLLDRSGQGKVYNLINRRRFQQMDVLEGLNVLVTISGMLLGWPSPPGLHRWERWSPHLWRNSKLCPSQPKSSTINYGSRARMTSPMFCNSRDSDLQREVSHLCLKSESDRDIPPRLCTYGPSPSARTQQGSFKVSALGHCHLLSGGEYKNVGFWMKWEIGIDIYTLICIK